MKRIAGSKGVYIFLGCLIVVLLVVWALVKEKSIDNQVIPPSGKLEEILFPATEEIDKPSTEEPNTEEETDTKEIEPEDVTTEKNPTKPPKKPVFPIWTGESNTQSYTKLTAVAKQARSLYNNSVSSLGLISRGGKMWDSSLGDYVDTGYLVKNSGLDGQYIEFSCDVLLVKGSDLKQLDGIEASLPGSGLGVYTAVRQPSGDKILISSAEGKVGAVSQASYRDLLNSYNQEHGAWGRLARGSNSYERILNFLRVYLGRYDSFSVRDIRSDNKYALVTASPSGNALDVAQYILVKNGSFWEVAMEGLEKEVSLTTAINRKLPDFNLKMLPPYTIALYKNDFKADFNDVYKVMINLGYLEDSNQISYKAGTTEFCYMTTYSGNRYFGHKQDGNWRISPVNSDQEALQLMREKKSNGPEFIILDE